MTWGIPTETFVQIHVVISLIAIAAGLVVVWGLLTSRLLGRWTALFLLTTILPGVTGFPLPPYGFDPPRAVGVILLVLMAAAVAARYAFHLAGGWRWIYVVAAVAELYQLELARESVRAAVEALTAAHPGWVAGALHVSEWTRKYGTTVPGWNLPA